MKRSAAIAGLALMLSLPRIGSQAATERTPEDAPGEALVSRAARIYGCNNFSTLIEGAVSEDDTQRQGDALREDEALLGASDEDRWGGADASGEAQSLMLGGIAVTLYKQVLGVWVKEVTTYTGTDGHYEFCGMPNGDYKIRFCHEDFVLEFWNGKATLAGANVIEIDANHQKIYNIDADLVEGNGPDVCP